MKYVIGLKFTVNLPGNEDRLIDFEIVKRQSNGSYGMTYRYHTRESQRGNFVTYSAKNMDGYFKTKDWILINSTMPNQLPEELFNV